MKRTLAITAVTALLALSLAACGAERNGDGGMPSTDDIAGGTTATDTMRNDNNMNGTGTTGGATANTDTAGNGLGGVAGAVNRATGRLPGSARYGTTSRDYAQNGSTYGVGGPNSSVYTATNNGGMTAKNGGGASFYDSKEANDRYQLMLENARVHDTDGFLFDGENAHYHTF